MSDVPSGGPGSRLPPLPLGGAPDPSATGKHPRAGSSTPYQSPREIEGDPKRKQKKRRPEAPEGAHAAAPVSSQLQTLGGAVQLPAAPVAAEKPQAQPEPAPKRPQAARRPDAVKTWLWEQAFPQCPEAGKKAPLHQQQAKDIASAHRMRRACAAVYVACAITRLFRASVVCWSLELKTRRCFPALCFSHRRAAS